MIKIEVNQVQKSYGDVKAVRSLSFTVEAGKIFALLGPNGAGKSSLIRMLVGLTMADSGDIKWHSAGVQMADISETSFAYLPEDRGLYPDKTVTENLHYIGKLRGLSKSEIIEQLAHWLPRLDLVDKAKDNLSKLSKGNQQKVQLISCLIHQPKLLILDEPFSGLDPINQEHVLNILNELKQAGTTIVLSAHQMALVERLADEMLLLNKGEQVALGSLAQVIEQLSPQRFYQLNFVENVALENLVQCAAVSNVEQKAPQHFILQLREDCTVNQLLQQVLPIGELRDFSRLQPSLHELYLEAVQHHNMGSADVKENTQDELTTVGVIA